MGCSPREDDLELVAAEPPYPAAIADHGYAPLGNDLKQRVARRIAERVVHLLEAIQILQEHGAGAVFPESGGQDLFERLRRLESVERPVSES
jgi:hypothetical protein